MGIKDVISKDLIDSQKAKDKLKTSTLRLLNSEIKNAEIAKGEKLKEEEISVIVGKEIKRRKEAIEEYKKGNRDDLVEKEGKEEKILKHYMPEQLSEEKIKEIISNAITEVDASGKQEMGKVMGKVMPQVKGKADGSIVNKIASQLLEEQ